MYRLSHLLVINFLTNFLTAHFLVIVPLAVGYIEVTVNISRMLFQLTSLTKNSGVTFRLFL